MTDAEKREAARQFYNKWVGKGKEDEDDRSYWLDILQRIMGADDATDRIEFQKKVIVDGNTKRIDAYIPETKVIIEQKTLGIALDKKGNQSGGIQLTPYEQAKRYNDNLPSSEKARWIVTSNFEELWVYDMDTKEPEKNITAIKIVDLPNHYMMLDFLLSKKVKKVTEEMELSLQAGELVGKIHDRFLEQYNDPMAKKTQNSLNILCVRLVFCLYAEDAGLFGAKDAFSKYLMQYEPKDIRRALLDLFEVLNTPLDERADMYLDDELAAFPYVNGGLFAREHIEIPKITEEIKNTLIESSLFDWSKISPTIFGAVFESTLNPETRRSGGMHYTSIENIHKVIDPLFLDELSDELNTIIAIPVERTRKRKLEEYQNKLASLKFLDPACGSGNFLTETYVSIRRLENMALKELQHGQIVFGMESINPIKVSIHQFFGIEINDFAVTVAKTALWIAESQMMKETEDVVLMHLDFLPLKTNATIIEGNALQLDWGRMVSKKDLTYIIGNPPFVGFKMQNDSQRKDMQELAGKDIKRVGFLDYVCGWYIKAANFIMGTDIQCGFVSTNSITQGEQPGLLWEYLYSKNIVINYAHRTFIWDNESNSKASVHCVIIGFSQKENSRKLLFDGNTKKEVKNINPYLVEGDSIVVKSQKNPLCDVPKMIAGNKTVKCLALIMSQSEKDEFLQKEPNAEKFIKRMIGAEEFINNIPRYCLWLVDASPSELLKMPHVMERVEQVRQDRLASKDKQAHVLANTPTTFRDTNNPDHALVVPLVSSERRRYIPIGYIDKNTIANNKVSIIPDGTLYHFGVLTSNVHNAWMRVVAMRMKSDYSYSLSIVYNTFPWPDVNAAQREKIEATAKAILDARAKYSDCSLADMYGDAMYLYPELLKAHRENDRAVMQAYGLSVKDTSEADCVAFLMKKYQELTN